MHFPPYALRPIAAGDGRACFQLIGADRSRLLDFFPGTVAVTHTLEETERYVVDMLERIAARTYFPFVIADTRTDGMVGFVDIKRIDWSIRKGELGAFVDAAHEKQGLGSKALEAITQYGSTCSAFPSCSSARMRATWVRGTWWSATATSSNASWKATTRPRRAC